MNWKNVSADNLPLDEQEVHISVGGVNFIATYNKREHGFHLKDSKRFVRIATGNTEIYWSEISDSPI